MEGHVRCSLFALVFVVALSTVTAQTTCEDPAFQGSCFDCFKYGGYTKCGWYLPRLGGQMCLSKGPDGLPLNKSINIDPDDYDGGYWYSGPGQCQDSCAMTSERRKCGGCTEDSACGWCASSGSCLRPSSDGSEPWLQEFFQCEDWRYRGDRDEDDLTENELCSNFEPCDTHDDCHECTSGFWALEQGCVWCAEAGADYRTGSCHNSANGTVCPEGLQLTDQIDQCPERPSNAHTLAASILLLVVCVFVL